MNDFVNLFCDLLDDTDKSLISETTRFKELDEWSSIVALSLIASVDESYGIALGTEDIQNADTLEDLYSVIKAK